MTSWSPNVSGPKGMWQPAGSLWEWRIPGGRTKEEAIEVLNKWWILWYRDHPVSDNTCYEGYGPRRPLPRWDNSALFKINITDVIPVSSESEEDEDEETTDKEKGNYKCLDENNQDTGYVTEDDCLSYKDENGNPIHRWVNTGSGGEASAVLFESN